MICDGGLSGAGEGLPPIPDTRVRCQYPGRSRTLAPPGRALPGSGFPGLRQSLPTSPRSTLLDPRTLPPCAALWILTLFLLASCAPEPALREPPVRLAVAGPLSGANAFQGQAMEDAARLAAEQVNASGGIDGRRVEVQAWDDRGDPARAAEIAREIVASDAVAVLGHRSSETCVAAAPVYRESGLAAVTASATGPEVTLQEPWYFRTVFDNNDQGGFLASYASGALGAQGIGIVDGGQTLGGAVRSQAERIGLPVEGQWSFDPRSSRPADQLATLARGVLACTACEVVVLTAPELAARDALVALRDAGLERPVLAGQAVGRDGFGGLFRDLPREREQPGFYTDRLFAASVALPDSGGLDMQAFMSDFTTRYDRPPDTSAAAYHDAARLLLADAAGGTGTDLRQDRARVRENLASHADTRSAWSGAVGRAWFDERHTAIRDIPVGTFVHGVFVSAPTQLRRVRDVRTVPDLESAITEGRMVRLGDDLWSRVQVAYAGLDVVDIPEIDLSSCSFVADIYLWFRYAGALDPAGMELSTAIEPTSLGEPLWTRTRGGLTTSTWRVKTTFRGDFDFHDFPFDRQDLRVDLRPSTRDASRLILALDRLGLDTVDGSIPRDKLRNALGRDGTWNLLDLRVLQDDVRASSTLGEVGLSVAESERVYSRVCTVATISRSITPYALKTLLPLGILVLVLYTTWYLPFTEVGTRTAITITAVLTVSVLQQQLGDQIPGIGYLVAADYAYYLALALAVLATIASVVVFLAHRTGWIRLARAVDVTGRVFTPLSVALLALLAWIRYW